MALPENLTHEEVGALLVLVGQHMLKHDVTAYVVLDLASYSDPDETRAEFLCQLQDLLPELSEDRAYELLGITLVEAVIYNSMDLP